MKDILKIALGSTYRMFYNPSILVSTLTPVQTLDRACQVINNQLESYSTNISTWDAMKQDEIARLLWVNLFYQNLDTEPIRKPILVHKQNNQLLVDCGDTRLMALQLKLSTAKVSVVITCLAEESEQYSTWQSITCDIDLVKATNFDLNNTKILVTPAPPDSDYAFEWMEIGDQSTSHHLHNTNHRVEMMQKYLNTQPADFKFSAEWVKTPIDWTTFF
tara:strand:+ start:1042 stop:1695 length:654 start_codon:yes stop_codon:yes gene_type:complete